MPAFTGTWSSDTITVARTEAYDCRVADGHHRRPSLKRNDTAPFASMRPSLTPRTPPAPRAKTPWVQGGDSMLRA